MLTIKGLDHLVLCSSQPAGLVDFYCSVLGCTVEREQANIGLVQLRAGDSLIDILAVDDGLESNAGRTNLDHFCLRIEPFNETEIREHLSRHDVEGSELKRVYGAQGIGPAIYIKDPEGTVIELKGPSE